MNKLFIEDLNVKEKKVLMRVDFNVPLDKNFHIIDSTRIEAALPSIRFILKSGGELILMSHLGRPKKFSADLSLEPVAKILSTLVGKSVKMATDSIGEKVREQVNNLKPGDILLLENLRFHRAEEHPEEDPSFAKELASYGNFFINEAFGTAHRKHSSTYTIAKYFPNKAAAGYLFEKEINFLGKILSAPQHPFFALIGGAKISSKVGILKSLLKKVDCLIIAGGMAYTFLKAKKFEIGNSLYESELVPFATEILNEYGKKIILPFDCLAAKTCNENSSIKVISLAEGIPDDYQGLDIGPATIEFFKSILKDAKTVVWNGPFGVYELDCFANGTLSIAKYLAKMNAIKIIGGGDVVAAIKKAGVADCMTHISTGGGATLEYIEYGTLPGIEVLSEKKEVLI